MDVSTTGNLLRWGIDQWEAENGAGGLFLAVSFQVGDVDGDWVKERSWREEGLGVVILACGWRGWH